MRLSRHVAAVLGRRSALEHADRPPDAPPVRTISAIGCGIGFDARLMATTHPESKARWGRIAYLLQAVTLARSIGIVPYHLVIDGRPLEVEASIAMITNMGDMVPGVIRPRFPAIPDDGLLDVFVVGARHALEGIADGATYADLGGPEREARAAVEEATTNGASEDEIATLQAEADQISNQRNSLFKGETLRGLLLSTYAWSTIGRIAGIAAITAFVAAAVMLVLVVLGIVHHRKVAKA